MTEPDPGSSDERAATESTEADAAPGDSLPARASAAASLPDVFPPTLREVMLRPQWIGMLLLCLVVAGVFAWLGQWQLARAIDTNPPPPGATEEVRPLEDVAGPGEYLPEPLVGQRVETAGSFVPGDFVVIASRFSPSCEPQRLHGRIGNASSDASSAMSRSAQSMSGRITSKRPSSVRYFAGIACSFPA